jgi:thiamine biosynthesis lipoprotein
MGMPVTVEVVGAINRALHERVFDWLRIVDRRFSPFRTDSEVSAINLGGAATANSDDMAEILDLAEKTRQQTGGYFDIRRPGGGIDPSGIVKGWAILKAAAILKTGGAKNFFVEAGGDIQAAGRNAEGNDWSVGIRNPFDAEKIVKVVRLRGRGVATSGTYARGQHIYDPFRPGIPIDEIVSLTVIGPDVLEADRFATAAFAMGRDGIAFVASRPELEGYLIDRNGIATMTGGFEESSAG